VARDQEASLPRQRNGHYCWSCNRHRPNERFSGRNHGCHVCRDCARLPQEELEYRQGERDLDRLLHDGLFIPRRRRAQFDRLLQHRNARVRALARQILAEQERYRQERFRLLDEEVIDVDEGRLAGGASTPARESDEPPF
jgi:hypothetical protein